MEFNEYQEKAVSTAIYDKFEKEFWKKYDFINDLTECGGLVEDIEKLFTFLRLSYTALGLAGESGELCNAIKKLYRDKNCEISQDDANNLSKELGDTEWYCANMAEELGYSLDNVVEKNIAKLQSRKERNVLGGSGDNR